MNSLLDAEPDPVPQVDSADVKLLGDLLALLQEIRRAPGARLPDPSLDQQLDLACQRFCLAYSDSPSTVRDHLRSNIGREQSWLLLQYSRRCAKLAWRSGNQDILRCGLIAQAAAGFRHADVRDSIVAIDEILKASVGLGMNPRHELERAQSLAGPGFAHFLRQIAQDRESSRWSTGESHPSSLADAEISLVTIAEVVKGIHDVTIVASNVAELRTFYASLGFKQLVARGDELAVFALGANELAIHTSSARPSNSVVLSILVEDLAPVQRRAAELGIRVNDPVQLRPGLIGIALIDPNGNKLEFLRRDS